jgi:Flp pilus assembly protein TadG
MLKIKTNKRCTKGVAVIEIVMILPFMILIFFMLVELGVAHINQSVLTTAARSAAREAARGKDAATQKQAADFALESLISWFDNKNIKKCNEDTAILKCTPGSFSYTIEYNSNYKLLPPILKLTGLNPNLKNIVTTVTFADIREQ